MQFSRKPEDYTSVHTTVSPSPPCTNPPAPGPIRCTTLPFASHPALDGEPALCPGKPVYTTEMSMGAGRPNQLGQEAPKPSVILQQRPLPLALFETFHSPCQCLSKRHYRQLRTIYSKNTGLTGGICFFKVMSLSPYNGECATWLIMCFQNYKFSDDSKEGPW